MPSITGTRSKKKGVSGGEQLTDAILSVKGNNDTNYCGIEPKGWSG